LHDRLGGPYDCDGVIMALSINSPADITVTEGQAVNIPWVASGGTVSPVSFVNKPTGFTNLEIIPSLTSYGNFISVGCGSTVGQDSKVLVSSDGGNNWTTLINSPADLGSCYTNEYDHNGVLWSFLSDDTVTETTGKIRIYRNGILYSTTDIPATDAWAFCRFDNGNYALGCAGNVSVGRSTFYKFTDGTQPVLVSSFSSATTQGRPCNILKLNGTTALSADLSGEVYKTTNSGDSWVRIGNTGGSSVQVLAVLLNGDIVCSSFGGATWKISTDGGVTWSTWGNRPNRNAYSRINNRDGLLIFGSITDRTVSVLRNNVWEYYLIPDSIIDRVYQADIINGDMYAVTGNATGDGRVYKSPLLPVYNATTTKNGSPYSAATNTTGLFPLSIPTAQKSDAGTYAITVTNAGASVSDSVAVVVNEPPQPEQYDCDDAFTRFLFEMTAREKWEPELSTGTSIHSAVGVISYFQSGEPENSYWKQWGGWYDNPKPSRVEIFVKSYLTAVQSMNELIATPFSFYQNGETYINTPLFLWQYSRLDVFLAAVVGFSSSVRDTHNQSDDTYSGIRYPAILKIPSVGMTQLPDPVNGVIPLPAFSVSLDNSDGYFDQFDTQRFFNSPVKLKKSTISRPNLSDFITIRTGKVDSVEISFSDYRVKTFETTRAFTMPVCRSIVADQFENMDSEIIGKALPVGYGPIKGCALIKIGEDENDFRYIALDPNYLASVSVVYNSDGNSISFSQSGGVITSAVAADRADVVGKTPCRIADIVVSEIELKAEIPYVEGLWDVSEVERYRVLSPEISLFVTSGNLKKLIEQALSNDSAFQFSKNNGELTIRRVGLTYDYHKIPEWVTTQPPTKSFSDSKDFCSSVLVNYLWDYKENGPQRSFLDDTREQEIFEIYIKNQRNIYDTTIQTAFGAEDLARRLLDRFSSRFEIVKLGTGYDCSSINPLDTVEYPIVVNERVFSNFTKWICRACDPAQDKLELEQYSALETYIAGTASFPSVESANGVASHVSIENESGETANPSIAKGN